MSNRKNIYEKIQQERKHINPYYDATYQELKSFTQAQRCLSFYIWGQLFYIRLYARLQSRLVRTEKSRFNSLSKKLQ